MWKYLLSYQPAEQMPNSRSCIARKEVIKSWPHLVDVPISELEVDEITLIIGLQEKPSIFLPLEYRTGGENDPVAIRYGLGWTDVVRIGERKDGACYSTTFAGTVNGARTLHGDLSYKIEDSWGIEDWKSSMKIDHQGDDCCDRNKMKLDRFSERISVMFCCFKCG